MLFLTLGPSFLGLRSRFGSLIRGSGWISGLGTPMFVVVMIVSIFMGADSGAGGGGPGLTLAPPTRWSREAPCASHCMKTLKSPKQAIAAQGARAADGASRAIALIAWESESYSSVCTKKIVLIITSSAAAFFASCFVLPFPS